MSISDELAKGRRDAFAGKSKPAVTTAGYEMGYDAVAPSSSAGAGGGGIGPLVLIVAFGALIALVASILYPFATVLSTLLAWATLSATEAALEGWGALAVFFLCLWLGLGFEQRLAYVPAYRLARHAARLCVYTAIAWLAQFHYETEAKYGWLSSAHWWESPRLAADLQEYVRSNWTFGIVTAYLVLAAYALLTLWRGPGRVWNALLRNLGRAPDRAPWGGRPLRLRSKLFFVSLSACAVPLLIGRLASMPISMSLGSALAVLAIARDAGYGEKLRSALLVAIPLFTSAAYIASGMVIRSWAKAHGYSP